MVENNAHKKAARARQSQTGESYLRARRVTDHNTRRALTVVLGRDPRGRTVTVNLAEAAHGGDGPHCVLVGPTGSGKTTLLAQFCQSLARRRPEVSITVISNDNCRQHFPTAATFVDAPDESGASKIAASLNQLVDSRMNLLHAQGAPDSTADQDGGHHLPPAVVVLDRADLGQLDEQVSNAVTAVTRLGRSLGIHLIAALHDPEHSEGGGENRRQQCELPHRPATRTVTRAGLPSPERQSRKDLSVPGNL